jgi:hypothetical protein
LENGTIVVKLNNSIGAYFVSHKGVRQGTPCLLCYLILWLMF